MNTPLRRIAVAVMAMMVLLLINLTYVQVIKAGDYRTDQRNQRVLLGEYSRERGQISAGGQIVADSVETKDRLKYLRRYANGAMYAPITGYYSVVYGSSGLEQAEDDILNGSDGRLFVRRLSNLITGRDPTGGNVVLTIDPRLQQAAYNALTAKHFTGSVVAIRPSTGEILAMVSTPSFDPNPLASHDSNAQHRAWDSYLGAEPPVLANRAISETYPPGSTFKLVVAAAALQNGATPETQLTAAPRIPLPDTSVTLENYNGSSCGGGPTASLRDAVARSCNTAFAQLAMQLGADKLRNQAEAFGIGRSDLKLPLQVASSELGGIPDAASLAQSGIGQRDVRLTPLQNAQIVAAIANRGTLMQPYLVKELQAPDLKVLSSTEPHDLGEAVPDDVAKTLRDLMIGSESRSGGGGKIPGVTIASKTGTAEHGDDPKNTPPHTWYVAFAPAENPVIAVAVIVEDGGNRGDAATGASVAAPIGREVIRQSLRGSG